MPEAEIGLKLTLKGRREAAQGLADVDQGLDSVADGAEHVEKAADGAAKSLAKASAKKIGQGFMATGRGVLSLAGTLSRGLYRGAVIGAKALGALSIAAGVVGIKAIALASSARETGSAFNTVFGPSARGIQKDLDQLSNKFGIYNPLLQDATRQFGVFGKAAGVAGNQLPSFSTDLTKAGLDLGSFYDTDPQQVFDALQSGLSGESEPLRKFGIFLSDANLNAFALSEGIGKTTKEMTDQEKVALRQGFIMANLGDAQGDLARTSGGLANQQRGFTGRMKDFLTMLGGPLATAATGAFQGLNAIAKKGINLLKPQLPDLEKKAGTLSATFAGWGKQMAKNLPSAIDRVVSAGKGFASFFDRVRNFTSGIDWGSSSVGLAGIGTALAGINWSLLADGLGKGVSDSISVFGVVIGFAADHVDTLAKYLPLLIAGFVAYKTAQAAVNFLGLAHIPILVAQIGANVALASANRALATQMAISNGVEKKGIAQRVISTAGMFAQKGAQVVLTASTKIVTGAQRVLNAVMKANPIGLVVLAITALVGGLILAYKKSETFRNIVNGAFDMVKKTVKGVLDWFGSWVPKVFSAVVAAVKAYINVYRTVITTAFKVVKAVVSTAISAVKTVVTGAWRFISAAVRGYVNAYRTVIVGAFNIVRSVIKAVMNTVKGVVSGAWKAISNTVTNGAGAIVDTIKAVPQKIVNLGRKFLDAGKSVVGKIFEGIKSAASSAGGFIADLAGSIKGAINNALSLPLSIDKPGFLGGGSITLIPAFANGTPFAPGGFAMVGERGPEIVEIARGSRVHTAEETRRMVRPTRPTLPFEPDLSPVVNHQIDLDMERDNKFLGPIRNITRVVTVDGKVLAEVVHAEDRTAEARA